MQDDSMSQSNVTDEDSLGDSQDFDDEELGSIDRPMTPRNYNSQFMDKTIENIDSQKIINTRPLIKMVFMRQRKLFEQTIKFNEREAADTSREIRAQNDPNFEYHLKKKIIDIGLQVGGTKKIIRTQTKRNRIIHRVLETIYEDQTVQIDEQSKPFLDFLKFAYKKMEASLQKNETISIFKNDLNCQLGNDEEEDVELSVTVKNLNTLLAKSGKVSCIKYFPMLNATKPQNPPLEPHEVVTERQAEKSHYILANSIYNNRENDPDKQLKATLRSSTSYIQLWDWEDRHSLEPIMYLTSPLIITVFDFNPIDHNMVIGGAANGQILLWDLGGKLLVDDEQLKKRKKQQRQDKTVITSLEPILLTELPDPKMFAVQGHKKQTYSCHRGPVVDIRWLPKDLEVDKKQIYKFHQKPGMGFSGQFLSLSANGELFFWETKFQEDRDPRKQDVYKFNAIHGFQLIKPRSTNLLGGSKMAFTVGLTTPTIYIATDEGELLSVDWTAKPTEQNQLGDKVQRHWQEEKSSRPCVDLDTSPFFSNILLTVHDYHFCVWDVELEEELPIFQSYTYEGPTILSGCFSPTRPGVIYIGKSDGKIQVWDLTDQSHKEVQDITPGSSFGITSIEFHQNKNLLSVGDQNGSLYLLELPTNLYKLTSNEKSTIKKFWERERERVVYVQQRFEIRQDEEKSQGQQKQDNNQELTEEQIQAKQEEEKKEMAQYEKDYMEFLKAEFNEGAEEEEEED